MAFSDSTLKSSVECSLHSWWSFERIFVVYLHGCPKTAAFHTTHLIIPYQSPHTKTQREPSSC